MAALSEADAVTRVLENLGRVAGDVQLPSTAIVHRLDDEYRRLRRRLSAEFPTIYEALSPVSTLTGSTTSFAKPTDCETVRVVEKQSGAQWTSIPVAPSLNRDEIGCLCFYEQGANIVLTPAGSASGSYRVYYVKAPATTVTTYDVPDGVEGIIIEETSAWARQRHNDDPTYHKQEAQRIWDEQYMALWNRYGSSGQPGLQVTRVW
jgi:hypothetical protein